jgi:hypothetical protein
MSETDEWLDDGEEPDDTPHQIDELREAADDALEALDQPDDDEG